MPLPDPQYYGFPGDVTPQFPQNRLLPTWRGCAPLGALPSGSYEGPVGRIAQSQIVHDMLTLRGLGLNGIVFSGAPSLNGFGAADTGKPTTSGAATGGKPGSTSTVKHAPWTPTSSQGTGQYTKPGYQSANYPGTTAQPEAEEIIDRIGQSLSVAAHAVNAALDIKDRLKNERAETAGSNAPPDAQHAATPPTTMLDPSTMRMPAADTGAPKEDKTLLYVAIAVGAAALLGVGYMVMKPRSRAE